MPKNAENPVPDADFRPAAQRRLFDRIRRKRGVMRMLRGRPDGKNRALRPRCADAGDGAQKEKNGAAACAKCRKTANRLTRRQKPVIIAIYMCKKCHDERGVVAGGRSREGTVGASTCVSGMKVAFRAADGKACMLSRENRLTDAAAVTAQQKECSRPCSVQSR